MQIRRTLKLSVKIGLNARDMEHLQIPQTSVDIYGVFARQAIWASY